MRGAEGVGGPAEVMCGRRVSQRGGQCSTEGKGSKAAARERKEGTGAPDSETLNVGRS